MAPSGGKQDKRTHYYPPFLNKTFLDFLLSNKTCTMQNSVQKKCTDFFRKQRKNLDGKAFPSKYEVSQATTIMSNERIVTFMRQVMEKYENIRGKDKSALGAPYWDVVVLTAADDEQRSVYKLQVQQKQQRKELPLGVAIHVVADPPGPKIGNGGSTLTALSFLKETYGDRLYSLRILLMNAGGQSQRMPSSSVMGKVFSTVPLGNPIYQMLDVKLAMFIPLIPQMCPGVFVTCADDFLTYNLESELEDVSFAFSTTGFTALAHPSSLSVGTGHGVYVLKDVDNVDPCLPVQQCDCLEVLQKPDEMTMYKKGAVLRSENLHFSDGIQLNGRAVYTDSSFFFSHDITDLFLTFLKTHGAIDCEIDAYGDFLQALGERASLQYINNTSNVGTVTPNLIKTRKAIFNLLNGKPISVLLMNSSKFLHIGTTKELIEHFCCGDAFQQEMGFCKDVFNLWIGSSDETSTRNKSEESGDNFSKGIKHCSRFSDISQGCVMHSILPKQSVISPTAVLEFCNFSVPVHVGQNVIISGCEYVPLVRSECSDESQAVGNLEVLEIPNDVFLHTIEVELQDNAAKYVTVFFDINDNLKKNVAGIADVEKLPFLGKTIMDYIAVVDTQLEAVEEGMRDPGSKVNLWFASLFPVSDSMTESLELALRCIYAVKKDNPGVFLAKKKLISMATVLQNKKVIPILGQRSKIFHQIVDKYGSLAKHG